MRVGSGQSFRAEKALALVSHGLRAEPERQIANTYLHSDHCGGNAALRRAWGCRISMPFGQFDSTKGWKQSDPCIVTPISVTNFLAPNTDEP